MQLKFSDLVINTPDGRRLLTINEAVIPAGITALTGKNGAGKSTLLSAIFGLRPLAGGAITLNGVDSRRDRQQFLANAVFQPQNFAAYPDLTGEEFLIYFLRLRGVPRTEARALAGSWLERVGLSDAGSRRAAEYSQGMLQRLGFAYAMQSGAPLCVLDEPFAGVDPAARADLSNVLADMARDRIILICTHHVDEMAARGATMVGIADGGWTQGVAT